MQQLTCWCVLDFNHSSSILILLLLIMHTRVSAGLHENRMCYITLPTSLVSCVVLLFSACLSLVLTLLGCPRGFYKLHPSSLCHTRHRCTHTHLGLGFKWAEIYSLERDICLVLLQVLPQFFCHIPHNEYFVKLITRRAKYYIIFYHELWWMLIMKRITGEKKKAGRGSARL